MKIKRMIQINDELNVQIEDNISDISQLDILNLFKYNNLANWIFIDDGNSRISLDRNDYRNDIGKYH